MKPRLQATSLSLALLLFNLTVLAQVEQVWVARYNGPDNDYDHATSVGVDKAGNVYVTGFGIGQGTGEDYATIKYDPMGNQLWVRRFHSGWDPARCLAVDSIGNVYVAGGSGTVKYDTHGNQQWVQPGDGYRITIGPDNMIYVIGRNGAYKYDPSGNLIWNKSIGSEGFGITADAAGNAYAVGTKGRDEWRITKFDAVGNIQWMRTYRGTGDGYQMARYVRIDLFGDIVVTGWAANRSTSEDVVVAKYNASGVQLWTTTINGPSNFNDRADYTTIDAEGNIYFAGEANYAGGGTDGDIFLTKLNRSGDLQWTRYYNGPGNAEDRGTFLQMDKAGNLYVTGFSSSLDTQLDYVLLKYDKNGNLLWTTYYDGPAKGYDFPESMALDDKDNIYITGSSMGTGTDRDYATIKYSQKQMVGSFTLVNAISNKDIRELKNGDTINLAQLQTPHLNIRANTLPTKVGSVNMVLSGAQTSTRIENALPYALFSDNQGDYKSWMFMNGDYKLTATPFTRSNGTGIKGVPHTIQFHVIYQKATQFVLVNAETDKDIRVIQPNDQIDLSTLPTRQLNIRVVTQPGRVGSVLFRLNNWLQVTENHFPYAIGGDINGNFRAWTLPVGTYTLSATPYQWRDGGGQKGGTLSVRFVVTDPLATATAGIAKRATPGLPDNSVQLNISPNPVQTLAAVYFQATAGMTSVALYNSSGHMLAQLYQGVTTKGQVYQAAINAGTLPDGIYYVRLYNGEQTKTKTLVVQR